MNPVIKTIDALKVSATKEIPNGAGQFPICTAWMPCSITYHSNHAPTHK